MDALPDQPGVRPPGAAPEAQPDDQALRSPHGVPLGQLLVERQLVTEEQLAVALAEQERTGKPLGRVLVDLDLVNEATVAQALATQHGGVLKTEYGFATGFGGNGRPGGPLPLPMLEPLVSPVEPSEATADDDPKRPTIGGGLPPPPPPLRPAEPVAVEEPETQPAVLADLFEDRNEAAPAEPAPPEGLAMVEAADDEQIAPVAPLLEDVDAETVPVAGSEGGPVVMSQDELLARVAELEATIDEVRIAVETAGAESAAAREDARAAADRADRLERELAVAGEAQQALRAELGRLAAAAEESLADRELQERLVRARLVELEQRLDGSTTPQG